MNKLYLTSCLLAIFALPAFADINKDASTATCDSATIGATSGSAYMDTAWTANTINLQWYSNGEQIDVTGTDSATCTYDGTITLPSTPQVPTGYTFGGWKVRVAAGPAQCNISDITSLNTSTNGSGYAWIEFHGKASTYKAYSDYTENTPDTYNITNPGEWAVEFGYGTIKGISRCSTVGDGYTRGQTGNPTDDGGIYCWCQLSGFDSDKDGEYCAVSSLWAFYNPSSRCGLICTYYCAHYVQSDFDLRAGLFGSVAQ